MREVCAEHRCSPGPMAPLQRGSDAPLSPPPLSDEPGPATGRSGAYKDRTLTGWPDAASNAQPRPTLDPCRPASGSVTTSGSSSPRVLAACWARSFEFAPARSALPRHPDRGERLRQATRRHPEATRSVTTRGSPAARRNRKICVAGQRANVSTGTSLAVSAPQPTRQDKYDIPVPSTYQRALLTPHKVELAEDELPDLPPVMSRSKPSTAALVMEPS